MCELFPTRARSSMEEQHPFKVMVEGSSPSGLTLAKIVELLYIGRSSNGRTSGFGPENPGSNPGLPAKQGTLVTEIPQ